MQSTIINNKLQVIQGDDQIYRYIAINNCTLDMDTLEKMTPKSPHPSFYA